PTISTLFPYTTLFRSTERARYTFGWFKALLGLEQIQALERNSNSRELIIYFGKVQIDNDQNLILSQPTKQLPVDIEDIENLTVRSEEHTSELQSRENL